MRFRAQVVWKPPELTLTRRTGQQPVRHPERTRRIASADIVLPTATTPPRELLLRFVVRRGKAKAELLDRLGLRSHERRRASLDQTQMKCQLSA